VSEPGFRANPENFCYRHPDRQSFVLCQRCLRTICTECQTPLPVGVICPECLGEQQKAAKSARAAHVRAGNVTRMPRRGRLATDNRPLVTYSVVGLTAFVYLLQLIPGFGLLVQRELALFPPLLYPQFTGYFEPWRLFSTMLVHGSLWHLALNMLALWMLGRSLEPLLGHLRFLWLYLLAGLGGSVAVVLFGFTSSVVGASGALFGMFGALLVIGRHIGANITSIAVVLGLNLVITFLPGSGISWQAHIGGLVVGALVGFIYARTRAIRQQGTQRWLLIAVAAGLLALLLVPAFIYA